MGRAGVRSWLAGGESDGATCARMSDGPPPHLRLDWAPGEEPWRAAPLRTARLVLRFPGAEDAAGLAACFAANRAFLAPWEPYRTAEWATAAHQRRVLEDEEEQRRADRTYRFLAIAEGGAERGADGASIVGSVALTGVIRGPFQCAHLGYWVAERWARRGLGSEMVTAAVAWGLGVARLHRIEAAVQPENEASQRLLRRAGFRHEGRAARYLHIAGAWRDHDLFARTVEDAADDARRPAAAGGSTPP